jgi:uncharacterized protein YbaR (Trm112 family)
MPVQEKFLDLLVCPACYGKLIYKKYEITKEGDLSLLPDGVLETEKELPYFQKTKKTKKFREELWCKFDKLAYLIKKDIPIMLVEDARTLSLEELDQCK